MWIGVLCGWLDQHKTGTFFASKISAEKALKGRRGRILHAKPTLLLWFLSFVVNGPLLISTDRSYGKFPDQHFWLLQKCHMHKLGKKMQTHCQLAQSATDFSNCLSEDITGLQGQLWCSPCITCIGQRGPFPLTSIHQRQHVTGVGSKAHG